MDRCALFTKVRTDYELPRDGSQRSQEPSSNPPDVNQWARPDSSIVERPNYAETLASEVKLSLVTDD